MAIEMAQKFLGDANTAAEQLSLALSAAELNLEEGNETPYYEGLLLRVKGIRDLIMLAEQERE